MRGTPAPLQLFLSLWEPDIASYAMQQICSGMLCIVLVDDLWRHRYALRSTGTICLKLVLWRIRLWQLSDRMSICRWAGKSAIHGWGAFTKVPAAASDMLVEYMGELLRRPVADARERSTYDRLVGAGTYVFGLSDELVVDATRKGESD